MTLRRDHGPARGRGLHAETIWGGSRCTCKAPADKFQPVMNWEVLNRLLGMTTIWSTRSLMLVLDKEPCPPAQLCPAGRGPRRRPVLRPDPARVQEHLARGATLVLNDIDQLTPELSPSRARWSRPWAARFRPTSICHPSASRASRAHFDFHDVFAMHVMGEKTWMVFKGRAEYPIKHPSFEGWPRERHEQLKGELWREVRLRPGDLLYLPRGQYHYALADDGPCVHIAWGVTYPIGMDVVSYGFERMIGEAVGRANLPRDRAGLQARLAEIGRLFAASWRSRRRSRTWSGSAPPSRPRERYDLPGLIEQARGILPGQASGLRLVSQGGRHGIVKEGTRQAVEIPAAIQPRWLGSSGAIGSRKQ